MQHMYGLIDGSRMFYLQLKNNLEKAGMRKGKLIGLVCSHVDDFFMAGNNNFRKMISDKILHMFKFSK